VNRRSCQDAWADSPLVEQSPKRESLPESETGALPQRIMSAFSSEADLVYWTTAARSISKRWLFATSHWRARSDCGQTLCTVSQNLLE
jgi:hypothetical protein